MAPTARPGPKPWGLERFPIKVLLEADQKPTGASFLAPGRSELPSRKGCPAHLCRPAFCPHSGLARKPAQRLLSHCALLRAVPSLRGCGQRQGQRQPSQPASLRVTPSARAGRRGLRLTTPRTPCPPPLSVSQRAQVWVLPLFLTRGMAGGRHLCLLHLVRRTGVRSPAEGWQPQGHREPSLVQGPAQDICGTLSF